MLALRVDSWPRHTALLLAAAPLPGIPRPGRVPRRAAGGLRRYGRRRLDALVAETPGKQLRILDAVSPQVRACASPAGTPSNQPPVNIRVPAPLQGPKCIESQNWDAGGSSNSYTYFLDLPSVINPLLFRLALSSAGQGAVLLQVWSL